MPNAPQQLHQEGFDVAIGPLSDFSTSWQADNTAMHSRPADRRVIASTSTLAKSWRGAHHVAYGQGGELLKEGADRQRAAEPAHDPPSIIDQAGLE